MGMKQHVHNYSISLYNITISFSTNKKNCKNENFQCLYITTFSIFPVVTFA